MNIEHLNHPEKAFDLARQTRSPEGARIVAKFCQTKLLDFKAAVEFLLMAKLQEEAFALAVKHNEMDKYAEALGTSGTSEDCMQLFTLISHLLRFGNSSIL